MREVIRNKGWEDIEDGDLKTHIREALKTGENEKILPEYKYSSFNSYIQIMRKETVLDTNNNFFKNYKQAYKALNNLGKDSIKNFANTLLKVPMLEISLSDESTAMNIFMTFNSKGKPLQDVDFYKDELFLAFPKSDEKDKLFSSTWDELCKKSHLAFKPASDDSMAMKTLFEFYQKVLPPQKGWDTKGGKDLEFFSRNDFACFKNSECTLNNLKNICNSIIIYRNSSMLVEENGNSSNRINNLFNTILQTKNIALLEVMFVYLFSNPPVEDIEIFAKGLLSLYILVVAINITDTDAKTLTAICCDVISQIYGSESEDDKIVSLEKKLIDSESAFFDLISNLEYKTSSNTALKIILLFNTVMKEHQGLIKKDTKVSLDHIFPKDPKCRSNEESIDLEKLINSLGNLALLESKSNSGKNNDSGTQKPSKIYIDSEFLDTAILGGQLAGNTLERRSWNKESMQARLSTLSQTLFEELDEGLKEFIELQNRHFDLSDKQQKLYKSLAEEFPAPHFPYSQYVNSRVIEQCELNTLPKPKFKLFKSIQFLNLSLTGKDKYGKEVDKEFSDAKPSQVYRECVNFLLSNYWEELKNVISLKESKIDENYQPYVNNEGTFYYYTKLRSESEIADITKMCKIVGIKAIVNCIL